VVCIVITEPYEYEDLVRQVANKEAGAEWFVVYFISLPQIQNAVEELGNQGWLGGSSLRSLFDSLLEGYRVLANEVLQGARQILHQAGGTSNALVIEGDFKNLKHVLKGKCSRLYTDDAEVLKRLQREED